MVNVPAHEENPTPRAEVETPGYALTGKIMLSAIIILFCVVVLMVCLHLYVRWYLLRARRRRRFRRDHHHTRRSTQLVFYVDPANPGGAQAAMDAATRGLDASVIKTLPVFLYSSKTHPESVECAVCLSEFEENEAGRVLPKCNHSFHIECIDMWFHSHSTCPLCRAPVEAVDQTRAEVVITVCEPERPEPVSSSGLCSECHPEEGNSTGDGVSSSSSSIGFRRKPSAIEIPKRNESFGRGDDAAGCDSPSTPSSFRSPMSRMLSFKRILSRERKANLSPSSGHSGSGGPGSSMNELDPERGGQEETQ